METEKKQINLDEIGIGTKEKQSLSAKPVKVISHRIDPVKNKEDKDVGDKLVLVCKHPEREDPIELSKVTYLKGKQVTSSGLWVHQDEDGLIPKNSALSTAMKKYGCSIIKDFDGKEIETEIDGMYLVIKAY